MLALLGLRLCKNTLKSVSGAVHKSAQHLPHVNAPPAATYYLTAQVCKTSVSSTTEPIKKNENAWRAIYRLPLVRWAAAFNSLKVYHGLVTAAGTPITYALEQAGYLQADAALVFAALGGTGLLTLILASVAIKNVVGFIYINDTDDKLKLAYVDFWGRRQETVVDVEKLLPTWEHKSKLASAGFYQSIQLRGREQRKYKLLPRYGVIMEPYTFASLFEQ